MSKKCQNGLLRGEPGSAAAPPDSPPARCPLSFLTEPRQCSIITLDELMGRLSKCITELETAMRKSYLARGLLGALLLLAAMLAIPGFAQITFERAYGSRFGDAAGDVQQTSDGGYIAAGYGYWNGFINVMYVYLVKTDSFGDTLWTRTYGDSCLQAGYSVQQTMDGGYIVAGYKPVRISGG